MSRGCITLLTDFGTADPYVAAMKGVMLSINPDVQLVDVSHEVAAHDVAEAGYVLASAFRHFPAGTVHVAVVDPGVGGERRILAAEAEGHVLLAPDNGLLGIALSETAPSRLISIENAKYFRQPVSATFHGRDVFAPVAAHITLGVPLEELGPAAGDMHRLEVVGPKATRHAIEGTVIHVDRFGNLVTNIARADAEALALDGEGAVQVQIGSSQRVALRRTYGDVGFGELLAVVGSSGFIEVSANCASAAALLGVGRRAPVRVSRSEKGAT